MRETKDSGASWVKKIPSEWQIVPLKSQFSFGKGLSITKSDLSDAGSRVLSYGQIHAKTNAGTSITPDLLRFVPESISSESPASLAKRNGFIFADTSEDLDGCGNCNYVDCDGVYAGYHTILLSPKSDENWKYLGYLFKTDAWRFQIRKNLIDVKVFSISQKVLKGTTILIPPKSERNSIVSYLDKKCATIDEAIARRRQIIEKLEEYKKSVIFISVTRGLNPSIEMKDSNIAWKRKVPQHWTVTKLGRFCSFVIGSTPSTSHPEWFNGDLTWFTPGDVVDGGCVSSSKRTLSRQAEKDDVATIIPEDSVIIVCIGASCGKVSITTKKASMNQQITALLPKNNSLNPMYLMYWLYGASENVKSHANTTTLPIINLSGLKECDLFLPPFSEQKEIVAHIDDVCSKIKGLVGYHEKIIEKLEQYRKSIIYSAVTGKIDCREAM